MRRQASSVTSRYFVYVTLFTSGFVDDVMCSHNGAYAVFQRQWLSMSNPSPPAWAILTSHSLQQMVWFGGMVGDVDIGQGQSLPSSIVLFTFDRQYSPVFWWLQEKICLYAWLWKVKRVQ